MNDEPIVVMNQITKRFGGNLALQNVDIEFRCGEVHSIVGENGAGKSTLIKILTGYHPAYEGIIKLKEKTVKFSGPREAIEAGIGCVYQERNLVPALTVAENIFLGRLPSLVPTVVDWKKLLGEADEVLKQLGLDLDIHQKVDAYPAGMRQMIEIARIIFSGADIIILDEPTSALSIAEREHLFEFINHLKDQGKCIIYISHFLEEVLGISDKISILKDGNKVNTYSCSDLTKDLIIQLMSRRFVKSDETPRKPIELREARQPVLECRSVFVKPHISDVSVAVHAGEALGFYGNIGSGITSLAESLFGLRAIDKGEMLINGNCYTKISPYSATNEGIRFIPEERRNAIWMGKNLSRNIALGNLRRLSRILIDENTETKASMKVIELMDVLPPDPDMLVESFSGGNLQKAIVGRCFLHPPKVLIICEPANGMDVGAKAGIISKLWKIKEQGVAIIVISSDPEVIVETCDRAMIFRRGVLQAELKGEQINKEELVRNA